MSLRITFVFSLHGPKTLIQLSCGSAEGLTRFMVAHSLRPDDNGKTWIHGTYAEDDAEGRALLAAYALVQEASPVGAPGITGATGATGPEGAPGSVSVTGMTGPTGVVGGYA